MSRRARALAFLLLAGVAAALAAGIADSYGSRVTGGYGPLRPVLIATRRLEAGKALTPTEISNGLESRRVPVRFVPSGALGAAAEALGLAPTADLPAGSYLLADQLKPPAGESEGSVQLGPRRHPIEIAVSGADALLAAGAAVRGAKVEVIVTTEPGSGDRGHTYVAAAAVPLLALGPGPDGPGPGGTSVATLALTKPQALRLIAAESYARKLTLLPEG